MKKPDNKENYDLVVKKSKSLIESRNSNSLVENKILSYGMGIAQLTEDTQQPKATFRVSDLKKFEGINTNNIYATLKKMDENSINKSIMIRDEKTNAFVIFNMIEKFTYDGNGQIEILFTKTAAEHFMQINGAYRKNRYAILAQFHSNHSFRIYELLSDQEYLFDKYNTEVISFDLDLSELKLQLGLVEFLHNEEAKLKKKLGYAPSAEQLFTEYPDLEPYKNNWTGFRRCVLERAKKEIDEMAQAFDNMFTFEYKGIGSGRGGKIVQVRFTLHKAKTQTAHFSVEEPATFVFTTETLNEAKQILKNEPVSDSDIEALLRASEGDVNHIRTAYKEAKKQRALHNLVGWMLTYIREGWTTVPSSTYFSSDVAKKVEEWADTFQEAKETFESEKRQDYSTPVTIAMPHTQEEQYDPSQFLDYVSSMCESGQAMDLAHKLASIEFHFDREDVVAKNTIKDCFQLLCDEILEEPLRLKTVLAAIQLSNFDLSKLMEAILKLIQTPISNDVNEAYLDCLKKICN